MSADTDQLEVQLHKWGAQRAALAEQFLRATTFTERRAIADDLKKCDEHIARVRWLWLKVG